VQYDGTEYSGWARQRDRRTVQGVLEEALRVLLHLDEAPRTACAGRTDAGVHARGQVAHADVPAGTWVAAARPLARLAGLLPADVRVTEADVAPEGFDARWSARSRRYAYRLDDSGSTPDPLLRSWVVAHPWPLDVDRLNQASAALLGEHDFAPFCKRREGASTVRTLLELAWARDAEGLVVAGVEADAFCHSMVRSIVGALLPVGDGRSDTAVPAVLLARGTRGPEAVVAPARGLCLEEVRYPPDAELAGQAERSRRWRGSDEPGR
jgi:tRNA pseudouridine38-40 synthase